MSCRNCEEGGHPSVCGCPNRDPDWSEREAVVAYLLSRVEDFETPAARYALLEAARRGAQGDHLQAAREGKLDAYRERAKELIRG